MKGACLPSIVLERGCARIQKSTFADHLAPGKNGIGDGGAIERVFD
jgi:hypothetical protein